MSARIGSMRHSVRLEAPVKTADGAGGTDTEWQQVATLWAAIRPLAAGEAEEGDGRAGRVTHEIVVRHRADLSTAMRFAAAARVFAIRSVMDPGETRIWTKCLAEELQP